MVVPALEITFRCWVKLAASEAPLHYGPEQKKNRSKDSHLIFHFFTSSGVNVQESEQVSVVEASSAEQARAVQAKELMDK